MADPNLDPSGVVPPTDEAPVGFLPDPMGPKPLPDAFAQFMGVVSQKPVALEDPDDAFDPVEKMSRGALKGVGGLGSVAPLRRTVAARTASQERKPAVKLVPSADPDELGEPEIEVLDTPPAQVDSPWDAYSPDELAQFAPSTDPVLASAALAAVGELAVQALPPGVYPNDDPLTASKLALARWQEIGHDVANNLPDLDSSPGEWAQALADLEVTAEKLGLGPDLNVSPAARVASVTVDPGRGRTRTLLGVKAGFLPTGELAVDDVDPRALVGAFASALARRPGRPVHSDEQAWRVNEVVRALAEMSPYSVRQVADLFDALEEEVHLRPDALVATAHLVLRSARPDLDPSDPAYKEAFKSALGAGGWGRELGTVTNLDSEVALDRWGDPNVLIPTERRGKDPNARAAEDYLERALPPGLAALQFTSQLPPEADWDSAIAEAAALAGVPAGKVTADDPAVRQHLVGNPHLVSGALGQVWNVADAPSDVLTGDMVKGLKSSRFPIVTEVDPSGRATPWADRSVPGVKDILRHAAPTGLRVGDYEAFVPKAPRKVVSVELKASEVASLTDDRGEPVRAQSRRWLPAPDRRGHPGLTPGNRIVVEVPHQYVPDVRRIVNDFPVTVDWHAQALEARNLPENPDVPSGDPKRTAIVVDLGGEYGAVDPEPTKRLWSLLAEAEGVQDIRGYFHGAMWRPEGTEEVVEHVWEDAAGVVGSVLHRGEVDEYARHEVAAVVPEAVAVALGDAGFDSERTRRSGDAARSVMDFDEAAGLIWFGKDLAVQVPPGVPVNMTDSGAIFDNFRVDGERVTEVSVVTSGPVPVISPGVVPGAVVARLSRRGKVRELESPDPGAWFQARDALASLGALPEGQEVEITFADPAGGDERKAAVRF